MWLSAALFGNHSAKMETPSPADGLQQSDCRPAIRKSPGDSGIAASEHLRRFAANEVENP
jgi:hypothetical protein